MPYPNLYIVGAAKSGTTSLHQYLAQHPDIYMSMHKEPHYFTDINPDPALAHMIRRVGDTDEYLALFENAGKVAYLGEASPSYLCDKAAAHRIHKKRPDAKIIILLRDPVERAYSHYLMDVREGLQTRPFTDALKADMAIKNKSWGSGEGHMYVELGLYAGQVAAYLEVFDRSQVFIGMFSDLQGDPEAFTRRVLQFLQLPCEDLSHIDFRKEHNAYAAPRSGLSRSIMAQGWLRQLAQSLVPQALRRWIRDRLILKKTVKPDMEPAAVELLAAIYAPDIEALEDLLGEPLPALRGAWARAD